MNNEYGCDMCGREVPNGAGEYVGDDRLCSECAFEQKRLIQFRDAMTAMFDTTPQPRS